MIVRSALPLSRSALYAGEIYLLPPTERTRRIVDGMNAHLDAELGTPSREAQFRHPEEDYFRRVGRLRKLFYTGPAWHEEIRALLREAGVDPADFAFDPLRLRTIPHKGHENPRAAPIYYGHRDTWYSNPQAQITGWIPLHDVSEAETFVFWPGFFAKAVRNDSEAFDHDAWIRDDRSRKIGWQNRNTSLEAAYPQLREEVDGERWTFAAPAGSLLFFSGQHLHRTTPNVTGRTRFSADFRIVHLEDQRTGIGAPNVDNRSTGSALSDHLR